MIGENYLQSMNRQFLYYKNLGEKAMAQIADEKLFWQLNEDSNSISNIVKHLSGNMISRWTDFFTSDGEKEWRNRDSEFEAMQLSKADAISFWNNGWDCLLKTLESLTEADLEKTIIIRTEPLQVYDAILRQLAHYPYHVEQIVYIGKIIKDAEFKTLSIAKNKSNDFNDNMKASVHIR